jgi:hypothetical protein
LEQRIHWKGFVGKRKIQSTANTSMSFTVKFWAPVKVLFPRPVVSS